MDSEGSTRGPQSARRAERIFREAYLELETAGEPVDFEAVVAAHTDLEEPLRLLYSVHRDATTHRGEGLRSGQIVAGRFEVVRKLGEGGFGQVLLARQLDPERLVALKILRPGHDAPEFLARFELECRVLALLRHPGIATLLESGRTEDGRPYLAMEYVEGPPLTVHCDRETLTLSRRLELFAQVCDAVQYAHQSGVIHRDIKPSNVLVSTAGAQAGQVKVIDFGLAKSLHEHDLSTVTLTIDPGQLLGTLEYMSPEQADPSVGRVDTRADVYALGVILYELLTGSLPFESSYLHEELRSKGISRLVEILRDEEPTPAWRRLETSGEAADRAAEARATDRRRLARRARGELGWIVARSLEKAPSRRYSSASELATEIRRYLTGEPLLLTRRPRLGYIARKALWRHRGWVATIAAALTGIVVVVAVATQLDHRERIHASRQLLATSRGRLDEYLGSLDQRRELETSVDALEEQHRSEFWKPTWMLTSFLERRRELRELLEAEPRRWEEAHLIAERALQESPAGSEAAEESSKLLLDIYRARVSGTRMHGPVTLDSDFFARQLAAFRGDIGGMVQRVQTVRIASDPPGATVHCFRLEPRDGRRAAVPIHGRGARPPGLRVERLWSPRPSGDSLREGDRLLSVRAQPVETRSDLARVLSGVRLGERISAAVRRADGSEEEIRWVPFPRSARWRRFEGGDGWPEELSGDGFPLARPYLQMDVTFEGYPLEPDAASRVGETGGGEPLRLELHEGSYLLVLEMPGRVPARLPIVVPLLESLEGTQTVRLLRPEEIPPGFVHVPEGPVATGGDASAFQSLPWGEEVVAGFFISRTEVTTGEWMEFVNSPEVLARTDEKGRLEPFRAEARDLLARHDQNDPSILPHYGTSEPLCKRASPTGEWVWSYPSMQGRDQLPVGGISHLAAQEYARWRSERARLAGEPWIYRLPTDREWERAARGVDRRAFVWGDDMVWSHCLSQLGGLPRGRICDVGTHPFDESVFGVRDLEGSMCEHTSGETIPGLPYRAYRGGSWSTVDEYAYRVSTRNGLLPWSRDRVLGVRLVAEPAGRGPVRGAGSNPR